MAGTFVAPVATGSNIGTAISARLPPANGPFTGGKKALIEWALRAAERGYEKGDPAGRGTGNNCNGTSSKTILTDEGEVDIAVWSSPKAAQRRVEDEGLDGRGCGPSDDRCCRDAVGHRAVRESARLIE